LAANVDEDDDAGGAAFGKAIAAALKVNTTVTTIE
jgi:hypothetical protein